LLNFSLDNAYYVIEDFEKQNTLPVLMKYNNSTKEISTEAVEDLNNFNIYTCYYEHNYSTRSFYRISNSNKTVVFYSHKELIEKFNKHNNN